MANLEPLVVTGDLIFLTAEERVRFYVQTCDSMGLDFRTRPLQYFEQVDRNGKRVLILYALRGASVQLSKNHNLTVKLSEASFSHDAVMFTATVRNAAGREDSAVGAGSLKGLEGKEYADAIMAAQTKAKRRGILDFVGSGLLDESEVEGMRGSVVELPSEELKNYVPIASAPPPVSADAPSKEVLPESVFATDPPFVVPAVSDAQYALAADVLGPDMAKDAPATIVAPALTEAEITSRLNSYRRDTLQQGGMRPSKGFGIAAKWAKYLSKMAPAKNVVEYEKVLRKLDAIFSMSGANGVVAAIESEIAS